MTTRRTFLKIAGAACVAGASSPLYARSGLRIGIGTFSYHNLTLDAMIEQLNALKITEIEMSRGEYMLLSHPKEDLFRTTKEKLDRAGIRCVSYYAATFKTEQEIDDAVLFAKVLGAGNITGDGQLDILKKIDRRLTHEGLTFGIHNHFFPYKFEFESPEDVLGALNQLSKTVGATADTGHFASCGYDPADAIRKLAPRLRIVHLKDIQAKGGEVNVLLGNGISKIREVMQELHRINFGGLVAVEYEKESDVIQDMTQQIHFARELA